MTTLDTRTTMAADEAAAVISTFRRHLSSGRASLGEMFGGHLEDRSHGALVYTRGGVEYLNCAGYGVFILGATHPYVTDAVIAQVRTHPVSTRILLEPLAAAAAEALINVCPPGLTKVHFVGSGTEATETALKMARAHGKRRLITTVNGYHGKTMGALSVTARSIYQDTFRPLLPDVEQIPYGDAAALEQVLKDGPESCFILEPVQGEGGVIIPPAGYLTEVQRLCRAYGCFLIADEILTGIGRLGRWWGVNAEGIEPDVMLVGKGLSGGVIPVAAAVATEKAYKPFDKDPFLHTSTFAGAPVAMAAAKAAIEAVIAEDAVNKASTTGHLLKEGITSSAQRHRPHLIREIRGEGLLIGVEAHDAGLAGELVLELLDARVLVNHSLNNSAVLRLTPPALLTTDEADRLLSAVDLAFAALARRFPSAR
ncbi:aminotransferase class III-fold pyridoxal phosphate-dependent enzyme [Streptomyces sp. NPDC006251]|uniref:aspartate aminotransferase family protein n=1 Tax=Streptomyces sp. NPDC006251 TaxID=3155718 RepID=UPI0033BA59DD